MSLTVTQRPATGSTYLWVTVGNTVVYKMQRKDFVFNQINDNGGFVQIQINGVDHTGSFANGNSLYVQSTNGVYDAFGTQTAESFSGGNTLITTNIAYISAAPGGFVNNDTLRNGYNVEVEVYDSANVLLNDSPLSIAPTSKGALTIDIRSILRNRMSPDIDANVTGSTETFDDDNVYLKFYIKYREVWTGSSESQTNDSANQFYGVLGARQIPSIYAGNLREYTVENPPLNDTDFSTGWNNLDTGDDQWTFTSAQMSTNPTFESDQAQRTVSLEEGKTYRIRLVGSVTTGTTVEIKVFDGTATDLLWTLTASTGAFDSSQLITIVSNYNDIVVLVTGVGSVIVTDISIGKLYTKFLTKLDSPVMWPGYPFLISLVIGNLNNNFYLKAFDGTNTVNTTSANWDEKIVNFDINQILNTGDEIELTGFVDKTIDSEVTEVLTLETRETCTNPVMLMGRNTLGGVLQWLFGVSQEYDFDYGDGIKKKRLVLIAVNLTINQWESLQDFISLGDVYRDTIVEFTSSTIKTSSRIGQQVYVVDSDGNKTGVIVMPSKNKTLTKQKKHIFELEIEYPEIFSA